MTEVAFVDIDTQVDFVEPGGKLYASGAEAIKNNLSRLIRHARSEGIPLVSSVDAHADGDEEFSEFPPHCLKGTRGQERVAEGRTGVEVFVASAEAETLPDPKREHVVLEKQQFSVFSSPVAERVFASTGAKTFVVFGVVTEVCVRFAVMGLLERGYAVRVVEDAIWPLDAAGGEAALVEMEAKGAVRVTTAQVLGDVLVSDVEIVEDRTATSTLDDGFLKLRRFTLRNTYTDGRVSEPYACDVMSRRRVDAVAVVLWHRDAEGGVHVHYREATRPPVWLRRLKQDELPYKDPHPFDTIGEIVAGVLEEGDDGPDGVRRRGAIETKEEAGYDVPLEAVTFLGTAGIFPSPGVTDEKIYLCAAEIDPHARGAAEGDGSVLEEGTRMITLTLREAIVACRTGAIPDAKTELGILRLADHLGYIPQLDMFRDELPEGLRDCVDSLGV